MIAVLSGVASVLAWFQPRRILYIAVAAGLSFAVWKATDFISDRYEAEATAVILKQQLGDRDEAIKMLNRAMRQQEEAEAASEAARVKIDSTRKTIEEIRRETAAANKEDNGALAPVLHDALRALDGL